MAPAWALAPTGAAFPQGTGLRACRLQAKELIPPRPPRAKAAAHSASW